MEKTIDSRQLELRDGKLWIDGRHRFLKIGKPQLDFSCARQIDAFIGELGIVKDKGFDCLELNCYWHHFDPDGDGKIDVSLEPLRRLIDAICARGMFPCLSVETYGVGGGQIPAGFWKRHPDSVAINSNGGLVRDDEYGYQSAVPSLFDADYLRASRSFIRDLVGGLDPSKILWYETTVEPQYMGSQWLDYSSAAKEAYRVWLDRNELEGPTFPSSFPIEDIFLHDPTWNRFRAEWLAGWINGDAQAFREIAGASAWICADYLDADEDTMVRRCGNPIAFLRHLTAPDIIQINWSWHNDERKPNLKAYQRVRQVMRETGRDWAVTEHMTINGTDYHPHEMEDLLRNTIANSTHFGWEFVDILADRDDPAVRPGSVIPGSFKPAHFSVYGPSWEPKPTMAVVDERWDQWMDEIAEAANGNGLARHSEKHPRASLATSY
jgi:hypothetical protein